MINLLLGVLGCWIRIISSFGTSYTSSASGLTMYEFLDYTLIAFDERVTFWLQPVRSLPCACVYNHYAIAHAYNAANTHAQGSDRRVEAKKLLSRRRQSEYRYNPYPTPAYLITNSILSSPGFKRFHCYQFVGKYQLK